jgi:hypothetical protein
MVYSRDRLKIRLLLAVSVLFLSKAWTMVQAAEPNDPTKNYMGINTNFLCDYDGENAFVDMMKEGRRWFNYNASSPAVVDSENWPTQDCGTVIFGLDNPLGVYKLLFEGQASSVASLYYGGTSTVSNLHYDAATNTSTADVTLNNATTDGLHFQGTKRAAASATNTGIRNVRLYRPENPTDGSVMFSTEWKTIIRKFHAIRFMNWLMTNTNPIVSWSQRVNPFKAPSNSVTINGNSGDVGCAMEHLIQACNETNCDLWMNFPVMVDDDYITKTAQLILYGSDGRTPYTSVQANPVYPPLNANLKAYLEYGNEIWNTAAGFQCFRWIQHVTDSINAATGGTHPIVFDGVRDQYYGIARWSAWRTVGISNLFRQVFGDAAMMTRVRPVLMGQLGGNWFNPQQLPWLEAFCATSRSSSDPYPNTNPKPVSYYIYAAGGSGYYGVNTWSATPDVFFANGNYPDSGLAKAVTSDAVWAGNYGLKRVAYEGGMSLDGNGDFLTKAQKLTLNADLRMKDATVASQNTWSSCAGELITYFDDIQNGNPTWEFTTSVNNPNSPKLQAIDKLRDTLSRAPVSVGGVVPCTTIVQAAAPSITKANGTYTATVNGEGVLCGFGTPGYWVAVPFTARQAGWYRLSVRCGANNSTSTIGVFFNGANVATRSVPQTLGNTSYITVQAVRGLNVVRAQVVTGGFNIRSIMLAASDTAVGVTRPVERSLARPSMSLRLRLGQGMVSLDVPMADPVSLTIMNLSGRAVARARLSVGDREASLPSLAAGAYRAVARNKEGARSETALVVRTGKR